MKSDWELLKARCEWYEFVIKEMLTLIGVPLDKLKFVQGTHFQLSREYTMDMYRMSALVTTEHTSKAGAEVVKMTESPLMSNLLYPILQALDEQYLGVDIQFGGRDQRKIFMFARNHLPRIGYKKRSHLLNPLIPGLGQSGKMSSSEPLSKVELDETPETIQAKLMQAYSVDGVAEDNGLLAILKYILFRYLKKHGRPFVAPRPDKWGGPQTFNTYEEVEAAFVLKDGPGKLMSGDLKAGMILLLNEFLAPLREKINAKADLAARAYPGMLTPAEALRAAAAAEEAKKAEAKTKDAGSTSGKATTAKKAAGKAAASAAPKKGKQASTLGIGALEIRVGKIVEVHKHPNADNLYVEQIDLGEGRPRTIVSGLVKFIPIEKMQDRLVLVCANLAPADLKGVTSEGMVLAASPKRTGREEPSVVDLVNVPPGAKIGEKVTIEGDSSEPDKPHINKTRLKKLLGELKTNEEGVATFKGVPFMTTAGPCTSTIPNGVVS